MYEVPFEPSPSLSIGDVAAISDPHDWESLNLSIANVRDPFACQTFEFFELDGHDSSRTKAAVETARHLPGVSYVMDKFVQLGDHATPRHSTGVAILTTAAVIEAGGSDEAALDAAVSGFVHDAGKLFRQDYIHLERKLRAMEFEYTKWHVVDTVLLAKRLGMSCLVQYVTGNHHGYGARPYAAFPERRWSMEAQAELGSRLTDEHLIGTALASADVYDASRSGRPERRIPRSHPDSMTWVNELCTPDRVKRVFGGLFRRYVSCDNADTQYRLAA